MSTSRRSAQTLATMLVLAATLAVLFIGSADAWNQCPTGYADCNPRVAGCETCISKDPKNCGKCNYACKQVANAVTACQYGKCCEPVCNAGYGNCDNNIWSNGCEKNLLSDPYNCGKCGYCCKQVPNAVTACQNGKCGEPMCKPGYGNCDNNIWSNGCEKSLTSDIYNCGKCGYCCPVTLKGGEATCSAGKCGQQCKSGTKYDSVKKCCVPVY